VIFAITREVSPAIGRCELTHLPRAAIDVETARAQHARYRQALADLGCRVVELPAEPDLPDAVFVEDTAVVLDELAVITRPGAPSRRPETAAVAHALAEHRPLAWIEPPGTLDGGDVLRVGRRIWVGLSGRSNPAGVGQLHALAAPHGYTVAPVAVRGCLHLKSAVTHVAPTILLVNPDWVEEATFAGYDVVAVDPAEPHAANALLAPRAEGAAPAGNASPTAIYPDSFPRTRARMEARGVNVIAVGVSELQKAEGAVTCCSLVFPA
jgi:dimethylargininase